MTKAPARASIGCGTQGRSNQSRKRTLDVELDLPDLSDRCRQPLAPLLTIIFCLLLAPYPVAAQADDGQTSTGDPAAERILTAVAGPRPVTGLTAQDRPNDNGDQVLLQWQKSPDDFRGGRVLGYRVFKATSPDGPFEAVGEAPAGGTFFEAETEDGVPYYFNVVPFVAVTGADGVLAEVLGQSAMAGPAASSVQWIHLGRINVLIGTAMVIFFILFMIHRAKAGGKLYIRKIAGLDAVDEAIGRATEMGKKVFYVPGIQDMDNVQTIAGMIILGYVAEMTATYDTYLEVPVCRSLVLVTAKEVVKEAYAKAGRPDSYHTDQVYYLTDDQFGYAAGIDGKVVREKPATIFYMGAFFAESLILAETGNASGAIQIAGTAMPAQLPFFVTACDYTLIGEELFAASAYLSKEPKLLGSLKGQDYAKAIILISVVIGIVLETFGIWEFSSLFSIE